MKDLEPDTRALLDLGREGDDPTDAAVDRNRHVLAQRLGVATLGASAVASAASTSSAALKLSLLAGAVLVAGGATWAITARPKLAEPVRPARSVVVSALPPEPAPSPPSPAVTGESTPPAPSPPRLAPAPAPARSLKEELELVRSAQQALNRGQASDALAILAEHARKYPSGALWQDREASRVLATCRSGDAAGARALADAFLRRAPQSPFADRVRAACR